MLINVTRPFEMYWSYVSALDTGVSVTVLNQLQVV